MKSGLTERQGDILRFISAFAREHGYPPTVREIGEHFGFLWPAARGHLKALERKGAIKINPSKSRGIEITGLNLSAGVTIPVAGRIRAGRPVLAVEDIDAHILVDKNLFKSDDLFSLRVTGESMIDAGILDGDYVIVNPQITIKSGEIGVALIGDEATVKRVFLSKGKIRLKPENKDMEPVIHTASEVTILGKVVGVIRKL